ncbi:MAG: hypothetical protein QM802_03505 [Agriterribacter sp.]
MKAIYSTFGKAVAAVVVLTSFVLSTASAGDFKKKTGDELPAELTYLGNINADPLFQLDLKNEEGKNITITIKNPDGEVLYRTNFSGAVFSKKIQFAKADVSDMKIRVIVTADKKTKVQDFEISKTNRVVDEVIVDKL